MRLLRVRAADFRNIVFADVDLSADRTFLLGANGQGKTNLLEAVGLLNALRSFRARDSRLLARHGAKAFWLRFHVTHEHDGENVVDVAFGGENKTVSVNEEPVRRLEDFIGRFPVATFCSDDIVLLRGSPADRRRWLDMSLASSDSGYIAALRRYHGALAGRNRLLKDAETRASLLVPFEKVMAPAAVTLFAARDAALKELAANLARSCAAIGQSGEEPGLDFRPSAAPADEAGWLALWDRDRNDDARLRATRRGPHRDDFLFRLFGRPAAAVASEGQQRGLVLGLSLAELARRRRVTGLAPVVLADDIVGELDPDRRAGFRRAIGSGLQVIATGTVAPEDAENWRLVNVSGGRYE